MTTSTPTPFEQVLQLVRRLPPTEQARLRAALPVAADPQERAAQRERNRDAIALLDAWIADTADYDDAEGGETWDDVLRALDADRHVSQRLFPHLAEAQ